MNKNIILPYLPSKKFIITFASVFVIGIGGLLVFINRDKGVDYENKNDGLSLISSSVKSSEKIDSDGDGLADWEESLWGTDINKVDSDGDGYSDGDEAKEGFNPSDFQSNPSIIGSGSIAQEQNLSENSVVLKTSNNLTENISYKLSGKIAEQMKNGIAPEKINLGDSLSVLQGGDESASAFLSSLDVKIDESILKIVDDSPEVIKKYIDDIAELSSQRPSPEKSAAQMFVEASQSVSFKEFDEYTNYLKTTIISLKEMSVPATFLSLHKQRIELMTSSVVVNESMRNVEADPVKAFLAIQSGQGIDLKMEKLEIDFSKLAQKYN